MCSSCHWFKDRNPDQAIRLLRAQAGKDICDRKIAPMKAHIRRYVNEKHDVVTAANMKEALESHGGIAGCRAAVAEIVVEKETGGGNKLKGISKFNNFEFTEAGIRVWRAYQLGPGSLVSYEGNTQQEETGMKVLQTFGPSSRCGNVATGPNSNTSRKNRNEVLFCDVPGCVLTFKSENEAQAHMDTGTHQLVLERETVYDTVRRKRAQHVTGIVSRPAESSKSAQQPEGNLSTCSVDDVPVQGWALKVPKTRTKTSEMVKAFLMAKFNEGFLSGKKANPGEVTKETQDARLQGITIVFTGRMENRTPNYKFFPRLSALQKHKGAHPVTIEEEENLNDDDFSSWEGRSSEQNLRHDVYEAVDLQHPLSFENRNICAMAKGKKLKNLKVVELKNICARYALTVVGNPQRKNPYIDAIEELVRSCSCGK